MELKRRTRYAIAFECENIEFLEIGLQCLIPYLCQVSDLEVQLQGMINEGRAYLKLVGDLHKFFKYQAVFQQLQLFEG